MPYGNWHKHYTRATRQASPQRLLPICPHAMHVGPFLTWLLLSLQTQCLSLPAFHTPEMPKDSQFLSPDLPMLPPFPWRLSIFQNSTPMSSHGETPFQSCCQHLQHHESTRKRCLSCGILPSMLLSHALPYSLRPLRWACGFSHF